MGSQKASLATTYLLGMLVTSCLGSRWDGPDFQVRLTGSPSRCQGQLEVSTTGVVWLSVCRRSWGGSLDRLDEAPQHRWEVCQQLHCGEILAFQFFPRFSIPRNQKQITCHGPTGSFSNCSTSSAPAQCPPLGLICQGFQTAPPPPTSPPPTTTPEPTAPPRLQLVAAPGSPQCAGVVEFYHGSQGGTILHEAQEPLDSLGNLLCAALQCGTFLKHLPQAEVARAPGLQEPMRETETETANADGAERRSPLPARWKVQNSSCASLPQCFQKIQPQEGSQVLALVCSGFQPKVQSRLVGGSSVCEGSVEVRQGARWAVLCDSSVAKRLARWEELCQEQQCGRAISFHALDTSGTSAGLSCPYEKLSQCYKLQERKTHCKRVFVTCQNPNPAGMAAGTVASIILTLVLLAVLLIMCGPIAYKKLVKKFRQKKQRQWIGPTGMSQSMSFHRNHTVRSQVENPAASHVDNEYSQPPRNSHLSSYPALEGALQRASAQPDNSSDSDYDLHTAQRL
ncbi:T-cell surface glycoprotein CD5 [Dipodomys spectabilis]|uniref:T-cell surface glycoprotein CD5 n=1 Tax=Dipodomys spectabilis TaxID=105255 RepID=UPI001C539F9D|nr:T-cell surface glycoprotein CD5 [Dipodomys spectabilis]XP_042532586.1 T-cell surface glycoprotein CD5 [Dipodomys spectabilis]